MTVDLKSKVKIQTRTFGCCDYAFSATLSIQMDVEEGRSLQNGNSRKRKRYSIFFKQIKLSVK